MHKKILLIITALIVCHNLSAQQTGSFYTDYQLPDGQTARAYYYAPEEYSTDREYDLLLGFHGNGQTADNIYSIFLWSFHGEHLMCCADNSKSNKMEVSLTGLNYLYSNYNTRDIITFGMSTGCYHAYLLGLSLNVKCLGSIMLCPYLRPIPDQLKSEVAGTKIGIIIGSNDEYRAQTMEVVEQIKQLGGEVKIIEIEGMGHQAGVNEYINSEQFIADSHECYDFIRGTSSVTEISDSGIICRGESIICDTDAAHHLQVYSVSCDLLRSTHGYGTSETRIDGLPTGIYFAILDSGGKISRKKLSVTR